MKDNFINIPFSKYNLDLYVVRKSIFTAIQETLHDFHGKFLDVGCGKMPYKNYILKNSYVEEYVGLDIQSAIEYDPDVKPDFTWDGITMPFKDESYECCMATEVLEHCPEPDVTLTEIYRVLKPGGLFFFTTPFIWNLHEVPHDEYRYTPYSLGRHLKNSGFVDIEIYPTGGWHLAMAQMMGLWLKRSPIKKISSIKYNALLSFGSFLIKGLIRLGKYEKISFTEGQMISGIYGRAKKS